MSRIINRVKKLAHASIVQDSSMHVPLAVHTSLPNHPQKKAIEAEKTLAKDTRLASHIAVMSDANKKKKILHPASSTAASKDYLLPQLFDAAPNCGMRLITTDLTDDEVEQYSDQLYQELTRAVPAKTYFAKSIPMRVAAQTFLQGSAPVADHLSVRTKNEISNTFEHGNMFNVVPKKFRLRNTKDLLKVVPPMIVFFGRYRLGILGATNSHYLTLMKVDKILDKSTARTLGLQQNQYVFYLHTGSGIIGRYIGQLYSAQKHLKKSHAFQLAVAKIGFFSKGYRSVKKSIRASLASKDQLGFREGTEEHALALKALQAAGNQGFANRTIITHALDHTLEKVIGRQVNLSLVYDAPHVTVSYEEHPEQDLPLWIHRNGTTRAYSASMLGKDSATHGEVGLLAGYENTWSYVGTAPEQNLTTLRSANHELGKEKNTEPSTVKTASPLSDDPLFAPVKTYTQAKTWMHQPTAEDGAFGAHVAKEIAANNIMELTARMRTIKVLTHYKP